MSWQTVRENIKCEYYFTVCGNLKPRISRGRQPDPVPRLGVSFARARFRVSAETHRVSTLHQTAGCGAVTPRPARATRSELLFVSTVGRSQRAGDEIIASGNSYDRFLALLWLATSIQALSLSTSEFVIRVLHRP